MESNNRFKKQLKVVHPKCAELDKMKAMRELKILYGSTSSQFPLVIFMRLIAEYRDIKGNTNNIRKVANLRCKQSNFLQALDSQISEDIICLDSRHSRIDNTLRELIMGIKSRDIHP